MIVNADEDLGDVLFCRLLGLRRRGLADVDGWKPVVSDGMGAIEIALDGIFVFLVDSPSFVSERVDNVAPQLRLRTSAAPKLGHIREELWILANGCVGHLESSVARPKRD